MIYLLNLNIVLQILLIIFFWGYSVLLLIKIKKLDIPEQRGFFVGLFGFFLAWGFLQLMYYLAPPFAIDPTGYETSYKIAYIFGVIAELSILIVIEKYAVPKTRFIFSIITLIGLVLIIIFPLQGETISGARLISYIFLPIGAVSIMLLYIYLFFKLSGKLRIETGVILLGITLLILGYLFDTNIFSSMPPFWEPMCSLLMLIGGFIVAFTYYRRAI